MPEETIILPPGWIESSNPNYGLASWGWQDCPVEQYVALGRGQAGEIARGFDEPDDRLDWYLRIAADG